MRKLVLYGAGTEGRKWLKKLGKENVFLFADSSSDKIGQVIDGVKCCGMEDLIKYKSEILIFPSVSKKYFEEVVRMLRKYDMSDVLTYSPYPSEVLRVQEGGNIDSNSFFEGHNFLAEKCCASDIFLGYASYCGANTVLREVKVGRYSAIGPNVAIIRGQHPTKEMVSIHPAFYSINNRGTDLHFCSEQLFDELRYTKSGYAVEIGNDVWIGDGVRIMEGVTIGDGAVIAAGGLVTKDVPPYMIVGGVPVKFIRNRFQENEKNFLQKLQWWNKPEEWIAKYSVYFYNVKKLMEAVPDE